MIVVYDKELTISPTSIWSLSFSLCFIAGAFNTDGFDVAGKNIYIHDCTVWNDDDTVCIKESSPGGKRAQCSENILVERVQVSSS